MLLIPVWPKCGASSAAQRRLFGTIMRFPIGGLVSLPRVCNLQEMPACCCLLDNIALLSGQGLLLFLYRGFPGRAKRPIRMTGCCTLVDGF